MRKVWLLEKDREKMKKYLAVDIGGTFLKYSLMNDEYQVLEEGEEPTAKNPEQFLEQIKMTVKRYQQKICGIAVCMAGFINPVTGENTDYSVGENFRKYNLKKELADTFNVRVLIENDSNCAAVGELIKGSGQDIQNFCMLTFGTGIGGAMIIDRHLYRGSHYKAAEAGLVKLEYTSSDGVSASATSVLVREVSRELGREVDGIYVFAHLDDPKVFNIYREWLNKAAMAAGNAAMLLDPEKMLIGGAVSHQPRFLVDLQEEVYRLYPQLRAYTKIEACRLGNQAGRIGALHLYRITFEEEDEELDREE